MTDLEMIHKRRLLRINQLTIIGALLALGLSHKSVYPIHYHCGKLSNKGRFWQRDEGWLQDIFSDASCQYHRRIKLSHPDKPTGSHRQAIELNALWERIKYLYACHGF